MQRIIVQIPPPPKPLSKTAVTAADVTHDALISPRQRKKRTAVSMVDAPYLNDAAFGGGGGDGAGAAVWVDHGRERIMCSSPRVEQFVINHHAFQVAQQRSERYMAAMGIQPLDEPEGSDAAGNSARTIAAVTIADNPIELLERPEALGSGTKSAAPAAPPPTDSPNAAGTTSAKLAAGAQSSTVASPKRTPRQSSAPFASRSARFVHKSPKVPPVGHYSIRFHMIDRDLHVPTIVPLEENKTAAQQFRAEFDATLEATKAPPLSDIDGEPVSARERAKARSARPSSHSPRNTSAFASRVPQLHVPRPSAGAGVEPHDQVNELALSGPRFAHPSAFVSISNNLPRNRVSSANATTSSAPRGVLCYHHEVPSPRLKGLMEFDRQSPRAVGEEPFRGVGAQQKRASHNDIKHDDGRSTDFLDLGSAGDAVNSKRRGSPKGNVDFDKQVSRKPLYSFQGLVTSDFADTNAADRAVRGDHMPNVAFNKQTPRPPVTHSSSCRVDTYDYDFGVVDVHVPAPIFEHSCSHNDNTAFGNIGAWKKAHYQSSELIDSTIDATRPKPARTIEIGKLAPRKPPKAELEDRSSKVIDPDKIHSALVQPRVVGDPHIAKRVSREYREQVRAVRSPRKPEAPAFYDVPAGVLYNPAVSPRRESVVEFDKMPPREKMKGGRNVIEVTTEANPHIGPGTYL